MGVAGEWKSLENGSRWRMGVAGELQAGWRWRLGALETGRAGDLVALETIILQRLDFSGPYFSRTTTFLRPLHIFGHYFSSGTLLFSSHYLSLAPTF